MVAAQLRVCGPVRRALQDGDGAAGRQRARKPRPLLQRGPRRRHLRPQNHPQVELQDAPRRRLHGHVSAHRLRAGAAHGDVRRVHHELGLRRSAPGDGAGLRAAAEVSVHRHQLRGEVCGGGVRGQRCAHMGHHRHGGGGRLPRTLGRHHPARMVARREAARVSGAGCGGVRVELLSRRGPSGELTRAPRSTAAGTARVCFMFLQEPAAQCEKTVLKN
mmetsp:Transcript_23032/g.46573  ORF Transcript_23032/g.46573 Transcript_23032/m.46573 type:complete len:218 (+) Transcript_23032:701-1354(+)